MTTPALHGKRGRLLTSIRELVFGLEDGLVSTTGAVAGIAAGTGDGRIVILSGLVLIAVESLSMAAGSYLSNKSHRQMLLKRIRDEEWEIEHEPEKETDELRVMYRQRGFSPDEIDILVKRITADKKLWLEEMMAKELRIGASDLDEPRDSATIMGVAYIVGGGIPVLPFFFLPIGPATIAAVGASILSLIAIGWWKAGVTGLPKVKSAVEMLGIAAAAAIIGYLIGKLVGSAFGLTFI